MPDHTSFSLPSALLYSSSSLTRFEKRSAAERWREKFCMEFKSYLTRRRSRVSCRLRDNLIMAVNSTVGSQPFHLPLTLDMDGCGWRGTHLSDSLSLALFLTHSLPPSCCHTLTSASFSPVIPPSSLPSPPD